ncbi:MAG: hypothetical protein NDF52_05300 [archaeon YNP-WB-062]|nr:hypothetical protein [Candidatus Culexarchaeum yellowstonense]
MIPGEPPYVDVERLINEAIDMARSRLKDKKSRMSREEFNVKVYEYAELILYNALKEVRWKLKKYALPT